MLPTMISPAAAEWAVKAAKKKGGRGRGRGLTDEEEAMLAGLGGGIMGGGMSHGLGPLAASKLADALKDRRDKRYGSGTREIRGGNPYGYSS
tara:strand:- start:2101 stop:2376 length:276 start_codon:yes stop_codon:yes gene_type:complete